MKERRCFATRIIVSGVSTPKKHHYLPEFYLKGFSTAGELWVYDRKRGTYDKRRPETTAIRKGFYAVKDEHGKKDYGEVERRLSVIESHADLLPENWSSYYESPMAQDGQKEDSLWANDTHRSRSCASCARRRQS